MPANRNRFIELWLTPVIGLALLSPLIYHWRLPFAEASIPDDWRTHLRTNVGLDCLAGIIPLFAAGCWLRLFRAWKWQSWLRVLAAVLTGCLIVGLFYYYALYPLPGWHAPSEEGEGNIVTIYNSDIFLLAILGGFAALASTLVAAALDGIQRKHASTPLPQRHE